MLFSHLCLLSSLSLPNPNRVWHLNIVFTMIVRTYWMKAWNDCTMNKSWPLLYQFSNLWKPMSSTSISEHEQDKAFNSKSEVFKNFLRFTRKVSHSSLSTKFRKTWCHSSFSALSSTWILFIDRISFCKTSDRQLKLVLRLACDSNHWLC